MRPLDPRLLRHAAAARPYVVLTVLVGTATAAAVVAQAVLLADVIAGVAISGRGPADVRTQLGRLAAVVLLRALLAGAQERFGHRAATVVTAQLRDRVLRHAATLDAADRPDVAALATLTTRGLDALDGYLTRYLPQLLLVATVTPAVLAVIWRQDTVAGVTVALTLPLVPLFMALVGMSTRAHADRRLRVLQRLGAQLVDLLTGLPTLRAFGREHAQASRVRQVGEAYRRATMRTLRAAFLSALVLETLTTLSVALVAVGVGLRLVDGDLDLHTGLVVLLLAPEVYLPLRMVGLHYHASVDGLAAAAQAFAVLDQAPRPVGIRPAPDLRRTTIRLDGVSIRHRDSRTATPHRLDAEVRPGEVVALVGPSGCGKTSTVAVLLGLARPTAGRVTLLGPEDGRGAPGLDLQDVDPAGWWRQVSWVPQHPALVPGTIADNVRLTAPDAGDDALRAAAATTGLDAVVAAAPQGWLTPLGQGGRGLSAGQRQRLALTRAMLRDAPLVILDEPTSHLDAGSEQVAHEVIRTLSAAGRTVVLVAHRPALAALADRVVPLGTASAHGAPSEVVRDGQCLPDECLPDDQCLPDGGAGVAGPGAGLARSV